MISSLGFFAVPLTPYSDAAFPGLVSELQQGRQREGLCRPRWPRTPCLCGWELWWCTLTAPLFIWGGRKNMQKGDLQKENGAIFWDCQKYENVLGLTKTWSGELLLGKTVFAICIISILALWNHPSQTCVWCTELLVCTWYYYCLGARTGEVFVCLFVDLCPVKDSPLFPG